MRVLVVDGAVPDRAASAGERATYDQIDGLVALGYDVTLCALVADAESPRLVEAIRQRGARVPDGFGGGLAHLRAVVTGEPWDVIVAHRPGTALTVTALLGLCPGATTVHWGHDIHTWRLQAQDSLRGNVASHHMRVTEVLERRCWDAYDATVYPTAREADYVSSRHSSFGRGMAMPYYRLTERDLTDSVQWSAARRGCLMVGTAAHPPNRDAVIYTVQEILPLLREQDPDASVTVVGDWPLAAVERLTRPGIRFVGRVSEEELVRLHSTHACLLAPLRFGAGTRRKIVAAMGFGLPVVTTSEGLRGLLVHDASSDDGLLVSNEPDGIVAAINRVVASPAHWQRASATALNRVASVYDAAEFDRMLAKVLERALGMHDHEGTPGNA